MRWWIIAGYLTGFVVALRQGTLHAVSDFQEERAKILRDPRWNTYGQRTRINDARNWAVWSTFLLTFFWPLVVAACVAYCTGKLAYRIGFKLLFPRGIVTEYDKEQKRLEDQRKYEEAKRLLEKEGIEVE